MRFVIMVPEGNDFREIHYHLMDSLGFQLGDHENTLVRPHDAAIAAWDVVSDELWETISDELKAEGLQ